MPISFMSQQTMINPAPERIIWCYRRLQPLFSEVQSTIKNRLFLQGLSENMNDDSFIDTRYPSVIAIDDLMRDATNSKDVCELFVDGSNHRNISDHMMRSGAGLIMVLAGINNLFIQQLFPLNVGSIAIKVNGCCITTCGGGGGGYARLLGGYASLLCEPHQILQPSVTQYHHQ
jgi:hypothetical protein